MITTTRSPVPAARPQAMQTFSTVAVPGWTWEDATCATIGCQREANGFEVRLDETIPEGRMRATYIRRVTARRGWTEHRDEPTGVTVFRFPPGTPCFQDRRDRRGQSMFGVGPHRRKVREHLHLVAAGPADHVAARLTTATLRGQDPRRAVDVLHRRRPNEWAEHLAESWNRMAHALNT